MKIGPFDLLPKSSSHSIQSSKVVLLFGWADAPYRLVAKYAQIYHRLDMDVLIYSGSSSLDFFTPQFLLNKRFAVRNGMAFKYLKDKEVIVHAFSNGGSLSFRSFVSSWTEHCKDYSPIVTHLVLDSLPGGTPKTGSIATTLWIKWKFLRMIARVCMWLILSLLQLVSSNMTLRISSYLQEETFMPKAPRLYLYSNADELIPVDQVVEHINIASKNGLDVHAHMFPDSPHVQHYRKYPKEYEQLIENIVK